MNKYKHMPCFYSMYHFSDVWFKVRNIQDISYMNQENAVRLLPGRIFNRNFIS